MLLFLSAINFQLPKTARKGNLGYKYTIDERKYCLGLFEKGYGEEIGQDVSVCEKEIDEWIDQVNYKCQVDVNSLFKCMSKLDQDCSKQAESVIRCSSRLKKASWLYPPDLLSISHN